MARVWGFSLLGTTCFRASAKLKPGAELVKWNPGFSKVGMASSEMELDTWTPVKISPEQKASSSSSMRRVVPLGKTLQR